MRPLTDSTELDSDSPPSARRGWPILPVALLILVAGIFVVSRSQFASRSGQTHEAIGKPAPELHLMRLSTEPFPEIIRSVPQSKVVLVHFWGTWCGPCKVEYPHLAMMAEVMQSDDHFRFLSVSCEGGPETFEGLRTKTIDYLETIDASTEVYADPDGRTRHSALERLSQPHIYYPTSIVIDREGKIRGVWEGYSENGVDEMRSMIESLLD